MNKESKEIELEKEEEKCERPIILDEVSIEELAVDGICGIY
jgi:mycofactocin precursor